jgi:hypothetical protein
MAIVFVIVIMAAFIQPAYSHSLYDWIKERPDSADYALLFQNCENCSTNTYTADTLRVYLDTPEHELKFRFLSGADTTLIVTDTLFIAADTLYIPGDTVFVYVPPDTIFMPPDTIYIPPDTTTVPPDTTVYLIHIEAEDYIDYYDTTPGNAFNDSICGLIDYVDLKFNTDNDSTCVVGLFAAGEWLRYNLTIPLSGNYLVELRASSALDSAFITLEIDSAAVLDIPIPNTGNWNTHTTIGDVSTFLLKDTYEMRLIRGGNWLDLNWARFTLIDTTYVPPDTTTAPPDTTIGGAPGDTVWAETQLGFINRLAIEAVADSILSPPNFIRRDSLYDAGVEWGSAEWFAAGEDIHWTTNQWFLWYYERMWFDPPPEWPSWYWNPPPEYPLKYPLYIIERIGTAKRNMSQLIFLQKKST